jgi:hypothetical protein
MKDFIPYKSALELKHLGFDEPCFSTYIGENFDSSFQIPSDDYFTAAPLFSQAFRFFRDKHLLFPSFTRAKRFYETATEKVYDVSIQDENEDELVFVGSFDSYEEGEIACLNKLIEIVKETK